MKKNSRIKTVLFIVLMAFLCIPFASCTKDNGGGGGGNDNTGIEFRILAGTDAYSGANHLELEENVLLFMGSTNNFFMGYGVEIASVGSVYNLSGVRNVPESGWVREIAVHPGYGYVIRYGDEYDGYMYARVYVEDWILSTDGGIIGAVLWYEKNWR